MGTQSKYRTIHCLVAPASCWSTGQLPASERVGFIAEGTDTAWAGCLKQRESRPLYLCLVTDIRGRPLVVTKETGGCVAL